MTLIPVVLLWTSGAFTFLAAIGMLRFPDTLLRIHAAAKTGTVGVVCSLLAILFVVPWTTVAGPVLLTAAFLMVTSPLAGHLLARATLILQETKPSRLHFSEHPSVIATADKKHG
ncbi:MAG: monovalent cation/H(+) antiporter subunit G [Candidatus Hydrogenedentota bacterium]